VARRRAEQVQGAAARPRRPRLARRPAAHPPPGPESAARRGSPSPAASAGGVNSKVI
jgi:hypothetical protein